MRRSLQDEVNQEESEQDEVDGVKKGADYTGKAVRKAELLHCSSSCLELTAASPPLPSISRSQFAAGLKTHIFRLQRFTDFSSENY